MNHNKLTFETEKLVVHWLEISIEGLYNLEEIQVLANYFNKNWHSIRPFESLIKELAKVLSAILKTNLMSYLFELV